MEDLVTSLEAKLKEKEEESEVRISDLNSEIRVLREKCETYERKVEEINEVNERIVEENSKQEQEYCEEISKLKLSIKELKVVKHSDLDA